MLTLTVALGALPVGASAVVPHPDRDWPPSSRLETTLTPVQHRVERLDGDASPRPAWAVCCDYLDEGSMSLIVADATVTRAELVRLLYRMAGSPAVKDLPTRLPTLTCPPAQRPGLRRHHLDPPVRSITWLG